MAEPVRIQRKRTKGWRMPEGAVYVGRPTRWGNPWKIGINRCTGRGFNYREEKVADNETAVRFFRDMLTYPDRNYPTNGEITAKLRGKNLACWCGSGPCHADVLLQLANAPVCDDPEAGGPSNG